MDAASQLQLVWLASLVAVVEQGSFTAAAQAVNRSQPRVSAHIAALERQLGSRLLERTSRGVQLTAAGAKFLPRAQAVLNEVRDGVDAVALLRTTLQGHVRIGSYPGASAVLVAPLMPRFSRLHPGVTLDLREGEPHVLEDAVAHGEVDFAIRTSDVPQHHHHVPSYRLFDEKIVLVVHSQHRLATTPAVDLGQLARECVIVTGDPQLGWADYRDRLDQTGIDPEQVMVVAQPTTVVALVKAGIGIGLLGAMAARVTVFGAGVTTRPLPAPLWQREIRIYHRADRKPAGATAAFLALIEREAPVLTLGASAW